jgi:hypothetical protein
MNNRLQLHNTTLLRMHHTNFIELRNQSLGHELMLTDFLLIGSKNFSYCYAVIAERNFDWLPSGTLVEGIVFGLLLLLLGACRRLHRKTFANLYRLLGTCFWREGLEAAFGPERRGVKEGWCARERPCPGSPVEPVLVHTSPACLR